jgi:hypothetical protein
MTEDVRTERSFCRICTAVRGILVDVSGDEVVRVRGDHSPARRTSTRRPAWPTIQESP